MHHVLVVGDQLRDSVGALVGVLMPAEKLVVGSAAFGSADTRTRTRLDNLLLAVHAQPGTATAAWIVGATSRGARTAFAV
jgi:hypothetical protein